MASLIGKRTVVAIGLVLALLAAVLVATAILIAKQTADQEWVEHTLDVQLRLARVSALLQDAETAQRGYMITDRPRFFDEYNKAAATVPGELDQLEPLLADNPKQASLLTDLRRLAATRLAFLGQAVDLQKNGKADDAVTLIKTGRGKLLMDQGTDALRLMADEEQQLLKARRATSRETAMRAQIAIWLSLILALGIGAVILRDSQARFAALADANQALKHAADLAAEQTRQREMLEGQLRQSQKMEAVGQLTGGLAHDFNNMLAIVIGSLDLARRRIARGGTDVSRQLEGAMEGAQRAAALTHRLLAFSRQQPLVPTVTDTNALIGGMAELLRRTIGETIRLETVQAGGLWRTSVDGGQLEQAIVNLAVNARDAMPEGGHLTIETFNASLDESYADHYVDVPAGQYVVIAVSDSGTGMAPEIAAKAFEPFFTTKDVGKGTGLGLSQVFGFVKQSGGHVNIYSELGHGTTVKIYLPRYRGADMAQTATAETASTVPNGSTHEIILVVEDEERVRRVAVDALRELGYTVIHASSGVEALRVFDRNEGICLLYTDIVMADMNGRQLADAVRELRPGIRVVYTTGYTRNAVIHDGKLDADVDFLAKPFTIEQLARVVRKVLDRAEPSKVSRA